MFVESSDTALSILAALSLAMARFGPLVVLLPLGGKNIRLRITIFAALASVLVPTILHSQIDLSFAGIANLFPGEILLGCAVGATFNAVIQSLLVAGFYIGQSSGTSESVFQQKSGLTSHGQLVVLVAIASLFLSGLHREVVHTLLNSYQWFPLGEIQQSTYWVDTLTSTGTELLALSIRLAAPVLICAGASWIMVGWIGKTAPAIGDFISTTPLHIVLVLVGVLLSLGTISFVMQNDIQLMLTRFF